MKNNKFIPVFKPSITLKNKFDVLKALLSNEISGTSKIVKEFEEDIAFKFDRKYAIAVSNGSVALDVALNTLNLNKDDEIIIPSFTIISCLSAISRLKLKPVFCDVSITSWCMTLEDVKAKFTKKTKAVLMVHTYGLPAEAIKIEKFCKENNLILIEDAAEAHGIKIDLRSCGSFGSVSTLSFYANKHITSGEGGMVLTNDIDIYKSALQIRNLDFINNKRFQHDNYYWNYRLGGLQAALGKSQIGNLNSTIKQKIVQGNFYHELLKDKESLMQLPLKKLDGVENNYWVFGVVLKKINIRQSVLDELTEMNIETRPFFWPLHLQNVYLRSTKTKRESLKNSEYLGSNGFYIPMGNHVSKKDQIMIAEKLISSIEKNM